MSDEGIVAICGTPLLVAAEFVGVLFAANRSPRPFTHDEVALLEARLAAQGEPGELVILRPQDGKYLVQRIVKY